MSTLRAKPGAPVVAETVAIDADRIVNEIFPDFALRTWRRWDAAGKCPRGFMVGGRKIWRTSDLKSWAEWGFPNRETFESRRRAKEGNSP